MLWYIIDGWNLVHKIPSIKGKPFAWKELIFFIKRNRLTGSRNNKVTIVFDGTTDLDSIREEKEFEIIFSQDKSADEIINSKVSSYKNKSLVCVISDDRQIISHTRTCGASFLRSSQFLKIKKKKSSGKESEEASKDISYTTKRQITEELRRIWLKE